MIFDLEVDGNLLGGPTGGNVGPAGPRGPTGPAGSGASYVHTQSSPALTWVINHNLGYRPSVDLYDPGGVQFDAEIQSPTVNQTLVVNDVAASGSARLI